MNTNDFADDACITAQPKSPSQVENQLISIDLNLVSLDKAIELIEERLLVVLRNDDKEPSGETCEEIALVGLANRLGNVLERIQSHDIKLRNILGRIEL